MSDETGPIVDLTQFPITAKAVQLKGEGPHTIRSEAICKSVANALSLPTGMAVSSNVNYATLCTCGIADTEAVEYRIRVNGFGFGKGAKKTIEYLSLSFVGFDASKRVVCWSEDLQGFRGTPAYWAAVHAGKPPPKLKSNPRDCALLTFVDANKKALPITSEIRALVSAIAPTASTASASSAASAASTSSKAAPAPKTKAPAKKTTKKKA